MEKHGYIVDEYGYMTVCCVRHKEEFDVFVDTLYPSGDEWLDGECDSCFAEAYYGCSLPIPYCEKHGRNWGPNKPCCDQSSKEYYAQRGEVFLTQKEIDRGRDRESQS